RDDGLAIRADAGSPRAQSASALTRGQHPRRRDDEIDDVTPWAAVRAGARAHVVRIKGSSWTMPALELVLGERELVFCAWGARAEGEAPRLRRVPRWLAGPAQFRSLVAELRRHGALG